jgi:hypothetical protein
MKNYFEKLSTGEYSDYSPNYYMGDVKITQKELDEKGIEVGDKLIAEYMLLPERPYTSQFNFSSDIGRMERYDKKTGETIYAPGDSEWKPIMEKWLLEMGYEELDEDEIPEINVSYSDLPNSKNWKQ